MLHKDQKGLNQVGHDSLCFLKEPNMQLYILLLCKWIWNNNNNMCTYRAQM